MFYIFANRLILKMSVVPTMKWFGDFFRGMEFAEFHERSRTVFEKNRIFDFEIVISKIKIWKNRARFFHEKSKIKISPTRLDTKKNLLFFLQKNRVASILRYSDVDYLEIFFHIRFFLGIFWVISSLSKITPSSVVGLR